MSATTAELNHIVKTQERPRSLTYDAPDESPGTTVADAPAEAPAPAPESIELRTLVSHKE